jgi:2-iminobutanoate/2-iminopropanoate deaminase
MARMTRTPVQGTTPLGAYSPGIIAEGRFLFVSGQGPMVDGAYTPASPEEETRLTLENVGRILASAGASFDDVVRCGVFLADMKDFDAMNGVYGPYFKEPRPARTTVQVAALPGGIKVEIDCVVLLPE